MASVRLDFTPPTIENVTKLHIEESVSKDGPFGEIETVTQVGTYGNYISNYTTKVANDPLDWFRIRWETSDGVFTPYSGPLQGGTKTLVQEIVDRTLLRNPSLNEIIVTQEAQAVISEQFPGEDPNEVMVQDSNYVQIRGMTNMTLARSLIATSLASGGSVSKFTAGLVSLQAGTTSADPTKAIEALIKAANEDLGTGASYILLMSTVDPNGQGAGYCGCGPVGLHGVDLTRTVAMVDYA